MATTLGYASAIIKSPANDPPVDTTFIHAAQLDPGGNDNLVEHRYYDGTSWKPLRGGEAWKNPVISTLNSPPGAPVNGDRHLVGTSPTGAFSARANNIAVYENGAWVFYVPSEGWGVFNRATAEILVFYGAVWNTTNVDLSAYVELTDIDTVDKINALLTDGKTIAILNDITVAINNLKGAVTTDNDTLEKIEANLTAIEALLLSDDTTLDELQEIVDYIKANRNDLDSLGIANVSGLQAALDAKLTNSLTAYSLFGNKTGSTAGATPITKADLREFWDMIVSGANGDKAIGLAPGTSTYDLFEGLFRVQHSAFSTSFEVNGGDLEFQSDEGAIRKKIVVDTTTQQIRLEARNKSTDALLQSIIVDTNGIRRGVAASGSDVLELLDRGSIEGLINAGNYLIADGDIGDQVVAWYQHSVSDDYINGFEISRDFFSVSINSDLYPNLLNIQADSGGAFWKTQSVLRILDGTNALGPLQIGEPADATHAATQGYVDTQIAGVSGGSSAVKDPVQDVTALKALDTTSATTYPDKAQILVEDAGSYRLDRDSSSAEDLPRIVQPTTGVGRWIKFSNTLSDHNLTENKQGGTTGEYYHLTAAQHAIAAANNVAFTTTKEAFIDQRPLQASKSFAATDSIDVSSGKIIETGALAQDVLITSITNLASYKYVIIKVAAPSGFKFEVDFTGALDGTVYGSPRLNRPYIIRIDFEAADTLHIRYLHERPDKSEVDFTTITAIDGTAGKKLFDNDFAGSVEIDTISIEEKTTVEVLGGGTLTFSTAILTDTNNDIYGEIDTVNPYIVIEPKTNGGFIIIYTNSYEVKTLPFSMSDVTSDVTASTTVRKNYWRPRVDVEILSIESVLAEAATGTALYTVDIHKAGTTIFTTKITHDASEPSSLDGTPYVFDTDAQFITAGQLVEFFVDQVGDTTPGVGGQLWITYREV